MNSQLIEKPIVERPVVLKLQCADGMGDAFDGVRLSVRKVISRIDAPRIAGPMMGRPQHAIHDRVAQIDIRRGHVNFRAQRAAAVGELTQRASAQTDRGSLRPSGRETGCSCPARSVFRGIHASDPR